MKEYEKMKLIDFIRPALMDGRHTVTVTQEVQKPERTEFVQEEHFYVAGRAYTLAADEVFGISPAENECGDFSKMLPFITLSSRSLPWERKIAEDIDGRPVPWIALIVLASGEQVQEQDIAVGELQDSVPEDTFFPDRSELPEMALENDEDLCHVIDLPLELYQSVMPDYADMIFLTHVKRVDLADTEDKITERDGDFSVVVANRFLPTGHGERNKSTVHLVSMLGMPRVSERDRLGNGISKIRLVSLYRWNVYSSYDDAPTFQELIDGLAKNTGIIGYDLKHEVMRNGYAVKKHQTRTGEKTYSLYRSALLPYRNKALGAGVRNTADGYLIYDPQTGMFDTSYSAAFQLGRLLSLARKPDAQIIERLRRRTKSGRHKALLRASIPALDVKELCRQMVKKMR